MKVVTFADTVSVPVPVVNEELVALAISKPSSLLLLSTHDRAIDVVVRVPMVKLDGAVGMSESVVSFAEVPNAPISSLFLILYRT